MRPTLIILTTIMLASVAISQPRQKERMMRERPEGRHEMMNDIQLTEEQQGKMQKLHFQMQKKQTEIQSKMKLNKIELREELVKDSPSRSTIEKHMKIQNELQLQMKMNMVDHVYSAKSILTPEQQAKFKKHFMNLAADRDRRPGDARRSRMHRNWSDDD